MSFDSVSFWLFFPAAWALWRLLPFRAAKSATLLTSLVFYGWWNPAYLPLIAVSAGVDYLAGARIHRARSQAARTGWLLVSLATNLGLLGGFKYGAFLSTSLAALGRSAGEGFSFQVVDWVIPVGISFYTFQSLSYTIDIYRGRLRPARSFRDFFLYVAFFPQLVAGPIVRAHEFLPQLVRRRPLRWVTVQAGLYHVVVGLFLKVVVADNLAPAVARVFDAPDASELSPAAAWVGMLCFGGQVYGDFAGYSAVAIGLAYLMGVRFPPNFDAPFLSQGLAEFWSRWHISLSTWLRDYLYLPLGGSRGGGARTYLNLLLTMVLGGLWHGPAWTMVAWGALHGVALCLERAVRGRRAARPATGRPSGVGELAARLGRIALVFLFFHAAWPFFRCADFATIGALLERLLVAPFTEGLGLGGATDWRYLVLLAPVYGMHLAQLGYEWFGLRKTVWRRALVAGAMALGLVVVYRSSAPEFIYFQF